MFKKDKRQYINIVKNDKQIKLDGQIIINGKETKRENSSFLIKEDEAVPGDLIYKLQVMEKNIPNTYISSITSNISQQIVNSQEIDKEIYSSIKLNDSYSVIIPKEEIENEKLLFDNSIDYIFSPFTLLYEQLSSKATKNSLNILINDNILYIILLDKEKDIGLNKIHALTSFENIKESQFYQDDISGQKLYDEVYFLEIQQSLSDLVQTYYQENKDVEFIEEVNILYTINQLSDDQLDSLHETLMAKVNYYYISFEDKLKILSKKLNASNYSFITPRDKKETSKALLWGSLALVSVIGAASVLYYKTQSTQPETKKEIEKPVIKKKDEMQKEIEPVIQKIELPNHAEINKEIIKELMTLFDIIPYDAVLKELEIKQNSSTIVCSFIADSTSPQDMKEALEKIYTSSSIILSHQNNAILSSIINNEGKLQSKDPSKVKKEYKPFKYLSIINITEYLGSILPKNSKIKFTDKIEELFTTYNFSVSNIVKEPKEFFDILENINKKEIPLNITYPVEFAKVNEGIMVKYNIQYHQKNKQLKGK
eukprot:Anaeramoba_ignava/a613045_25.p1 GENE.a613045_25~~a613045_25.p1  ORF type:complete len:540 (-),score=54.17 a613045_25:659-2278(-)